MTSTLDAAPHVPIAEQHRNAVTPILAAIVSGTVTALVGLLGVAFGGTAMFHRFAAIRIGWLLPLVGVRLSLDPLGGLFVAVTGAVAVAVGVYAVGFARREQLRHTRCSPASCPSHAA